MKTLLGIASWLVAIALLLFAFNSTVHAERPSNVIMDALAVALGEQLVGYEDGGVVLTAVKYDASRTSLVYVYKTSESLDSEIGQQIAQRMLLELYCKGDDTKQFRETWEVGMIWDYRTPIGAVVVSVQPSDCR